jgi:hypothetical protein
LDRQGSAAKSFDKSDTAALSFRTQQDALDYASDVVQDGNDRLAAQGFNFIERYRKGELNIVVKIKSKRRMGKRDLVFRAVPMWGMQNGDRTRPTLNIESTGSNTDGREQSVFVSVAQLVQGPEKVIPSLVRLEPAKKRKDFVRQFLGATATYCVVKSSDVVPKGKVRSFGRRFAGSDCGGVTNLIEDGAERFNGFGCSINASNGNWSLKSNPVHPRIHVQLGDAFVGVFCMSGFQSFFELSNVLFCTCQTPVWAVKGMTARDCHERKIRSDGRPRVSKSGAAFSKHAA